MATLYTSLSFPTNAFSIASYAGVLQFDSAVSASGVIVLPAVSGIAWNGGTLGAAGAINVSSGATSALFSAQFQPGSYGGMTLSHTGLGFSGGDPTLSAVTSLISKGIATTYSILGFPTVPLEAEVYNLVVSLNGAPSAGSIILPATPNVSWNGGSIGGAGSVTIGAGSTSAVFTMTLIAGTYTAIALTHTGLGFTGADPTIAPFSVTVNGAGIDFDELLPTNPRPGSIGEALVAAVRWLRWRTRRRLDVAAHGYGWRDGQSHFSARL